MNGFRWICALWMLVCASFCLAQGTPSILWAQPGLQNNGTAVFTPDNDTILDGTEQTFVRLRDVTTGLPLWELSTPLPSPKTLDVNPDGSLFALGRTNTNAGKPSVYRMDDQSLVWEVPTGLDCFGIAFTGTGDRVFTVGSGGGVKGYSALTGAVMDTWGSGSSFAVARSRDGLLMAYSQTSHIFVRDLTAGAIVWDFPVTGAARCLRITPDNRHLAAWISNEIQIWSLESGTMERQWLANTGSFAPWQWARMDMSPDGRYLVSTHHDDPRLTIYRLSDGALVRYFDAGFGGQPDSPCYSRDGRAIFFSGSDGFVRLINSPIQPEEVLPDTVALRLGWLSSGTLASFFDIEGNAYRACRFFVPNPLVAPVRVDVTGTSPKANPTSLMFRVTSRMSAAGSFAIKLLLYNYDTSAFEEFPVSTIGTTYGAFFATPSGDLSRFVGPGNKLTARYEIKSTGFVAVHAWCNETELARWSVN